MRLHSTGVPALMRSLVVLACISSALAGQAQNGTGTAALPSFTLSVPVDEVGLTFHVEDADGLPVNDLKLSDLALLDNGKPPRRMLDFYVVQDHAIRAGILMDASESMEPALSVSRAVALRYAQHILRQSTDQAFVMAFGYSARIMQPWTSNPAVLAAGIGSVTKGRDNPLAGTAIFSTLYQTCMSQFGNGDRVATGNFILLFSDGEDNAGLTSLENVVTACQHTNTAIYAFRAEPEGGLFSSGPTTLATPAAQTGGRVFAVTADDAEIDADLRAIEADQRNQYRLVYKPAEWRHDGAFHRIELTTPKLADSIAVRSGYYAPVR